MSKPDRRKNRHDRRSISVKGLTYDRLKDYCDVQKSTMSGMLEQIIKTKLDGAGVPMPVAVSAPLEPLSEPPPPPSTDPGQIDEQARKHFTF